MATPAQVRSLLKKINSPYNITKMEGSWYVMGGQSDDWYHTCLFLPHFKDLSAQRVVDMIMEMEEEHTEKENKFIKSLMASSIKKAYSNCKC
jgi:hypothetical protein